MEFTSPDAALTGIKQDTATLLARAIAMHQGGDLDGAQALYAEILEREPANIDALYLDGLIAYQRGQYGRAVQRLESAQRHNPSIAAIHTALGNVYREDGNAIKAEACYRKALELDRTNADAQYNIGILLHENGDLEGAISFYRLAAAGNSAHAESWINLGVALKTSGNGEEAAACYLKALELQPFHAMALYNLGVLHADARRPHDAIACFRRALEVQPAYSDAAFHIGLACRGLGALEDSAGWFRHALKLQPQHAEALQNLGAVYYELGNFDAAEMCFRQILDMSPDNAEIHYNLALVALARGDYVRGWPGYEWRWQGAESSRQHRRDFSTPPWRGEDIAGKTILLHAEQGLGDALQFVRYASLVADKGARVVLECQAPLVRLFQSVRGVDAVVRRGDNVPSFAMHCPLMSLPLAFGTRIDSVPADIPYLAADERDVIRWKERLGPKTGMRVGLVWAGNPRRFSVLQSQTDQRRSLALQQLVPLERCKGIDFISLQLGDASAETAHSPKDMVLRDFTAHIEDFADTAALVANLDLVISVDTSVAHLAAAMGKPVWMLSRYDACWRWMREGEDTPWYPTMRIFRQPSPGDWTSVINRLAAELDMRSQDASL